MKFLKWFGKYGWYVIMINFLIITFCYRIYLLRNIEVISNNDLFNLGLNIITICIFVFLLYNAKVDNKLNCLSKKFDILFGMMTTHSDNFKSIYRAEYEKMKEEKDE